MDFFFRDDLLVAADTRESNVLNNHVKLVVPKELVPQVFVLTHDSFGACHQGLQKTIARIKEHFYWPGMFAHIKNLVESCVSCQQRRAHNAKHLAPLQRMPTPEFVLNKVHADVIGPLPLTFSGNKYIISYIDSFSKWPEAYAVPSITSDVVADTLADFIARFGAPCYLVTDQGKNFVSEAITKVYKQFGIRHVTSSPYHPSGNSQIERQHRTLINALSHTVNENQTDWDTKLKFALLALRTAVHSSTGLTPAAVMFGRNINLPYSLFLHPPQLNYNDAPSYCELLIPALQKTYTQVHNNLVKVAESQEKYREKFAVCKNIKIGDEVWLFTPVVKLNQCKKLSKQNSGPFTVIKKINQVTFKLALISNPKVEKIAHVDRLTKVKSRIIFPSSEPSTQPEATAADTIRDSSIQNVSSINGSNRILRRRRRRNMVFPTISSGAAQDFHTAVNSSSPHDYDPPSAANSDVQSQSVRDFGTSNAGFSGAPDDNEDSRFLAQSSGLRECLGDTPGEHSESDLSIISERNACVSNRKSKGGKKGFRSKQTVGAPRYSLRNVNSRHRFFKY